MILFDFKFLFFFVLVNVTFGHTIVKEQISIRRFTDLSGQVARASKFCNVAPNILWALCMQLASCYLSSPRILRWLLHFLENF